MKTYYWISGTEGLLYREILLRMKATFFKSATELRSWLEANHDRAPEIFVGFYKKDSKKVGITYPEALDQALCFGWIDGVRKSIDEVSYVIRFTPRKSNSYWSAVNVKRAEDLKTLCLMHPAGLKVFQERDTTKMGKYSYEEKKRKLAPEYEKKFKANKKAWEFFQAQAPSYQRAAIWWVISAKKEETQLKRLSHLMEESEKGSRLKALTSHSKS